MEELITTEMLSEKIHVHKNTVYSFIRKGMPHIKIGKVYRFELDKVLSWLQQQNKK